MSPEAKAKIEQFLCTDNAAKNDLCDEFKYYEDRLTTELPFFKDLNEPRQLGLIGIASHLGINDFLSLSNLFLALETHDYARAAAFLLSSAWPEKIASVVSSIAETIKSGIFPNHKKE